VRQIWDVREESIHRIFVGHAGEVFCVEFSPNGLFVVSGARDNSVRIWQVDDGSSKTIFVDAPDDLSVASVAISPDCKMVAAGAMDNIIRVWDTSSCAQLLRLSGHENGVYSIVFAVDGQSLISGSWDQTLKYWDLSASTASIGIKGSDGHVDESTRQCMRSSTGHEVHFVVVLSPGCWLSIL
jgi:glucose repression regulatory protein TUP1